MIATGILKYNSKVLGQARNPVEGKGCLSQMSQKKVKDVWQLAKTRGGKGQGLGRNKDLGCGRGGKEKKVAYQIGCLRQQDTRRRKSEANWTLPLQISHHQRGFPWAPLTTWSLSTSTWFCLQNMHHSLEESVFVYCFIVPLSGCKGDGLCAAYFILPVPKAVPGMQ